MHPACLSSCRLPPGLYPFPPVPFPRPPLFNPPTELACEHLLWHALPPPTHLPLLPRSLFRRSIDTLREEAQQQQHGRTSQPGWQQQLLQKQQQRPDAGRWRSAPGQVQPGPSAAPPPMGPKHVAAPEAAEEEHRGIEADATPAATPVPPQPAAEAGGDEVAAARRPPLAVPSRRLSLGAPSPKARAAAAAANRFASSPGAGGAAPAPAPVPVASSLEATITGMLAAGGVARTGSSPYESSSSLLGTYAARGPHEQQQHVPDASSFAFRVGRSSSGGGVAAAAAGSSARASAGGIGGGELDTFLSALAEPVTSRALFLETAQPMTAVLRPAVMIGDLKDEDGTSSDDDDDQEATPRLVVQSGMAAPAFATPRIGIAAPASEAEDEPQENEDALRMDGRCAELVLGGGGRKRHDTSHLLIYSLGSHPMQQRDWQGGGGASFHTTTSNKSSSACGHACMLRFTPIRLPLTL